MSDFMKLGTVGIGAMYALALSALTAMASPAAMSNVPDRPGTTFNKGVYQSQTVSSQKACDSLCAADPTCRGTIQHKSNKRRSTLICSFLDGTSQHFMAQPFDVNRAVQDLNAYRAEYGLRPVTLDQTLIEASRIHADDLAKAGIISHDGTDGSTHGQRINRLGYNFAFAGENVATGQRSWESVFQAWKDSPSHNDTLLHPDVSEFGIALVEEPTTQYGTYWAMLLTKPMDMSFLEARNVL